MIGLDYQICFMLIKFMILNVVKIFNWVRLKFKVSAGVKFNLFVAFNNVVIFSQCSYIFLSFLKFYVECGLLRRKNDFP